MTTDIDVLTPNTATLESLPFDIITLILDELSLQELGTLSITSRSMYQLVNHQDYWNKKIRIHFPHRVDCMNRLIELKDTSGFVPKDFFKRELESEYKYLESKYKHLDRDKRNVFFFVKQGNLRRLLTIGLDSKNLLLLKDQCGLTLLDWGRINNHRPILDYFFQLAKNTVNYVHQFDDFGYSIFHWAVLCGQIEFLSCVATEAYRFQNPDRYNKNTPLHLAADSGQLLIVRAIVARVRSSTFLEQKNQKGKTAFYLAVERGYLEIVEFFIEQDANLKVQVGEHKRQAIHLAAQLGHLEIIKAIVANDASTLEEKDVNGNTALTLAVKGGHLDIVEFLIKQGANLKVQVCDDKRQAIHLAVQLGHLEVITVIVAHDASTLEEKDVNGNTALTLAVKGGHLKIVAFLMDKRANLKLQVGEDKRQAIYLAAQLGHLEIIKAIVEKVSSNLEEDAYGTALYLAVEYPEIVKYFISQGANLKVQIGENKNQAIHFATLLGRLETIIVIVAHDASTLEEKDVNGNTALTLAVKGGHLDIVKFLIERGANLKVQVGEDKSQAIHLAVQSRHLEIIKVIVAHDASILEETNGEGTTAWTDLYLMLRGKQLDIIKFITDQIANFKLQIDQSKWPSLLRLAVCLEELSIVKAIVKSDPSTLEKTNANGETALTLAVKRGFLDIIAFLINQGAKYDQVRRSKWLTLFDCAVSQGNLAMVKAIVAQDLSILNVDRKIALYIAVEKKHLELVKFLIDQDADLKVQFGYNKEQALHRAVQLKHLEIIKAIVKKDRSTLDEEDASGKTPVFMLQELLFECKKEKESHSYYSYYYSYYQYNEFRRNQYNEFRRILSAISEYLPGDKVIVNGLSDLLLEIFFKAESYGHTAAVRFRKFLKTESKKAYQKISHNPDLDGRYQKLKLMIDKHDKLKKFTEVLDQIKEHSEDLDRRRIAAIWNSTKYYCAVESAQQLLKKLQGHAEAYLNFDAEPDAYETFKKNCLVAINEAKPVLEKHRGWKCLLANLILAILGAGVVYALACCVNKAVTGHYLFFSKTRSIEILDTLDHALLEAKP